MSSLALLKVASEDGLFTGPDGNPWGRAWAPVGGEADVSITVALWECGLLSLPAERAGNGCRRWEVTRLGRRALRLHWKQGPPGFMPTPGGPYDVPEVSR